MTTINDPIIRTDFARDPSVTVREPVDEDRPSFVDAIAATFKIDSSLVGLNAAFQVPPQIDMDFDYNALQESLSDPDRKKRAEALPLHIQESFGNAQSESHLDQLIGAAEIEFQREQLIANAPVGWGARILGNVIDPIDLGVAAVTGPSGWLYKGGRLVRAAKAGITASGVNASIEASVASASPFRDEKDVAIAALFGLALGAPLGSLGHGLDEELAALANEAAKRARGTTVTGDDIVAPGGSMVLPRSDLRADDQIDLVTDILENTDDPKLFWAWLQKLQFNYANVLMNSESPLARKIGHRMLEVGVPLDDAAKTKRFTVEGRREYLQRTMDNYFMKRIEHNYKAWLKANKLNRMRGAITVKESEEFANQVSSAMRGIAGTSKEAQNAAREVRAITKQWLTYAKEAGVDGFENVKIDANYVPRIWNSQRILRHTQKHGWPAVERWLRGALQHDADGVEVISKELAEKMARGLSKKLQDKSLGVHVDLWSDIDLENLDGLRHIFGDEAEDIIKSLEEIKIKQTQQGGKVARAQRRVRLNEAYTDGVTTINDLVETDIRKLMLRYSNTMSGHIAFAKELGVKSKGEYDSLVRQLRLDGHAREAQAAEDMWKLLTGIPIESDPHGAFPTFSRLTTKYNFIRVGGGFGIAQLPELANVVSHAGILSFIKYIPEYRKLLRRARDGELDDELLKELDWAFAPGTDWLRNPVIAGFGDDTGIGFGDATLLDAIAKKLDPHLVMGGRLTSALSGMAPILAIFQRMAGMHYAARLADISRGSRKLTKAWAKRYRDAGLDDAMQARLLDVIREHAEFRNGKLRNLHIEKWGLENNDVVDAFRMAGTRMARQMIQENDLGNVGRHAVGPIGRILFQFMNFTFNSINKQLLHGIAMHDIHTVTAFLGASIFASLAYTAQNAINYANDPKERKKRLETGAIAAAAVGRAGWGAILVPTIDNVLRLAGQDPVFSRIRTSGMGTSVTDSSPTVTLIRDLAEIVQMPGDLLVDSDARFSQEMTKRLFDAAPFHNLLGIRNGLAALNAGLPKQTERQE